MVLHNPLHRENDIEQLNQDCIFGCVLSMHLDILVGVAYKKDEKWSDNQMELWNKFEKF